MSVIWVNGLFKSASAILTNSLDVRTIGSDSYVNLSLLVLGSKSVCHDGGSHGIDHNFRVSCQIAHT